MSIGEEMIKAEAAKIRKQIAGGSVWGVPLEAGGADAELIAAYYLGVLSQHLDKSIDDIGEWVVTENGTAVLHKQLGYPFP